jgi:DNA-binding NtrC family response regulator
MGSKIFVVEDNPVHQEIMHCGLTRMGYEVTIAEDAEEALEAVQQIDPDLFLIDLKLPGRDGFSLCEDLNGQSRLSWIPRIIVTGVDTPEIKAQGLLRYADDYVTKPFDFKCLFGRIEALLRRVKRAAPRAQITSSKTNFKDGTPDCEILQSRLIGSCDEMHVAFEKLRKFGSGDEPVLLTGESGTGKRLAAEIIHQLSDRADGPFVVMNCGAIPQKRIETVLFGHEKGDFSGAVSPVEGKVEMAQGGTLFLNDVDQLPLSLQAKLVGFLEDSCPERMSDTQTRRADVRIVAASNRGQKKGISTDSLQEDLDAILYTHVLSLPPLRDRGEDSVLIAKCLFEALACEINSPLKGFTAEALDAIRFYSWPGNVRELVNCVRRAFHVAKGPQIEMVDLGIKPTSVVKGSFGRQELVNL